MELMTKEEVAQFFKQKDKRVIDNWIYQGVLPKTLTIKIGRKVFFVKHKLEEFITQKVAC